MNDNDQLTFDLAVDILGSDGDDLHRQEEAYQFVRSQVEPLCKTPTTGVDAEAFEEFLRNGLFVGSRFFGLPYMNPLAKMNAKRVARIWDQWDREWMGKPDKSP